MSRSVIFFSHHFYGSQRRAGFHELARAFAEQGWEVLFVTTGISLLSVLAQDARLKRMKLADLRKTVRNPDGVRSTAFFSTFHPVNLPSQLGSRVLQYFTKNYGKKINSAVAAELRDASLVIFESSAALCYVDSVREITSAKLVYRVSDDVSVVGMAEKIVETELEVLDRFDVISVPSRLLLERKFSSLERAKFHPHGLSLKFIHGQFKNPFDSSPRPRFVSVGSTRFDNSFIEVCAPARVDVDFHIVGKINGIKKIQCGNVFYHGELNFDEAAGYSQFGDVGLALYKLSPQAEYLAETSNKIAQYLALGRPVITPRRIASLINSERVFGYEPENRDSMLSAVEQALTASKSLGNHRKEFFSWSDTANMICYSAGL